jgi:hypothetical protein
VAIGDMGLDGDEVQRLQGLRGPSGGSVHAGRCGGACQSAVKAVAASVV